MRTTLNRTLALAIAAGVTVTGAQAVAPATGNNSLIKPAVAEAQIATSNPTYIAPTIDDSVYYDTTIEGAPNFNDPNNPRIYTLRQARAIAKTQSPVQGYLLNNSADVIYHGDVEMYTVDANTNQRVQGAPRTDVIITNTDGSATAPYQNNLHRNGRIELGMPIYAVPGTWGAAIKVNNYSTERHTNMKTRAVTSSYYRVVDLNLGYAGKNIAPGQSATIKLLNSGSDSVPDGTIFELGNNFNNYEGWDVSVNQGTGNITVRLDENAPVGTNLLIPVVVNYPNGTPETITALASSSYASDPGVREVRNNNGVYTIVRTDGTEVNVKIDTTGDVTNVTVNDNGDLVITYDNNQTKTVSLKSSDTTVTETGRGTSNHQITIIDSTGTNVTFNAYDNYVTKINPVGEGKFELVMRNGDKIPGSINLPESNGVVDGKINDDGDLVLIFEDGTESEPIVIDHTTITHKDEGTPWHTVTITTPNGETATLNAFDIYISKITKNAQGDYEFYRTDKGEEKPFYTLSLKDLRDRIEALEDQDSPSREEFEQLQNFVNNLKILLDDHLELINKNSNNIGDLRQDLSELEKRVNKLTLRVDDLERYSIKRVRDNKDGSYTLIRVDGSEVDTTIDGTGNVRNIIANSDGSITLVYANGETSDNIPLAQTTITESNKGKPNHTITITSPNGDTVTFNAFDIYVTDVKKNDKGDYDIYRSDIGGGKKVWKTIVLSDLRDDLKQLNGRVTQLEKDSKRHEKEIADLKKQIERLDGEIERIDGELDDLRGRMDDAEKRLDVIEGDIVNIKNDIAALDVRVIDLEKRVTSLETSRDAWAKCYSGISMLAMPLALATPLYALSQTHLPGVEAMNTQIQKQLGVYNEQLARIWSQHGDVLGVASAVVGIAATIGAIAHISNECRDYNETKAVRDTKVGNLSSKRYTRLDERAAKREAAQTTQTVSAK